MSAHTLSKAMKMYSGRERDSSTKEGQWIDGWGWQGKRAAWKMRSIIAKKVRSGNGVTEENLPVAPKNPPQDLILCEAMC